MNTVADKIIAREFVITSELTPPKGVDLSDLFAKAESLKGSVDAFNLTESPRARMAIAPSAVARQKMCNPLIFGSPPPLCKVTPAATPCSCRSSLN